MGGGIGMKKRILAIFLSLTLFSITSSFPLGSAAVEPVNVTGVGIFDQTPNKGIHTFDNGAKLIQVRFSGGFYDPAQLSGGQKLWVQSELGDYIKINGKTVSQWNAIEFNSVQIHVKTSAALGGQYLEINLSQLEGLPAEDTDSMVQVLAGFPLFGQGSLAQSVLYGYTAGQNLPFAPIDPTTVTGVGIFDQTPNKGIHTFENGARLIQVRFSGGFYDPAQLSEGQKLWVQSELGDYIKINGKTVSQWNAIEFNSVQIHVKTGAALGGQYLEINLSQLEGLPVEDTDSTLEIMRGFPIFGQDHLAETAAYAYSARSNLPFTVVETLEVTGVGIFDQTPNKGIHTFENGARLIQVTFNRDFWPAETQQYVELDERINLYLKINGKTPSQWVGDSGDPTWGCVSAHVKRSDALGQYLEINFTGVEGLPSEETDSTIEFLPGFAGELEEGMVFRYKGGYNIPFRSDAQGEEPDLSAAAYTVWDFRNADNGFAAAAGDQLTIRPEGVLYAAGAGGYLESPGNLAIPADAVRTVELRLKSTAAATLSLAWSGGNAFADQVSIPLETDGAFHDYQIDLAGQEGWTGTVSQLRFSVPAGCEIEIAHIRLTGLYIVPFPWLSGRFEEDVAMLTSMKNAFSTSNGRATVGFSSFIPYLSSTDSSGNLSMSGIHSLSYLLRLAKETDMPVMIWLRADPWSEPDLGVAQSLYADDHNLMWTEQIVPQPAYRGEETGYYNFCLAQTDLSGGKTPYWTQSEKLLGQCAEKVAAAIQDNPGFILGVTTTSEYRYLSENQTYALDYNPNTIQEFRNYCREKYDTLAALNSACGTAFTTWELRSTDYNPVTVENAGGFDAPRERFEPAAFWDLWTDFRADQARTAVQKLVDLIGEHIDSKYIYTHQIPYDDYMTASPISTGDVAGANIGIDFFNEDVTDANMQAITDMLAGDVTRTWGCPEWLMTRGASYDATAQAMGKMLDAGVKYLCPFNWGSGDSFDIQNSPSQQAIADVLASL